LPLRNAAAFVLQILLYQQYHEHSKKQAMNSPNSTPFIVQSQHVPRVPGGITAGEEQAGESHTRLSRFMDQSLHALRFA
jgi:hypothetical protein